MGQSPHTDGASSASGGHITPELINLRNVGLTLPGLCSTMSKQNPGFPK